VVTGREQRERQGHRDGMLKEGAGREVTLRETFEEVDVSNMYAPLVDRTNICLICCIVLQRFIVYVNNLYSTG